MTSPDIARPITTDDDLSASVTRFVANALRHDLHYKLSARRDLYAKAIYGIAYSHAMKRARDGKLEQAYLIPERIAAVADDFRSDPAALLSALATSVEGFQDARGAIARCLASPAGIVGIVAEPSQLRDSVALLAVRELAAAIGPKGVVAAVHLQNGGWRTFGTVREARHVVQARVPGEPFPPLLRSAIGRVLRSDPEGFLFNAIDTEPVGSTVGAQMTAIRSRRSILVADDLSLLQGTVACAPPARVGERLLVIEANWRPAVRVVPVTDIGDRVVHKSVPAKAAAWLAAKGGGVEDWPRWISWRSVDKAAQAIADELGALRAPVRARRDVLAILRGEGMYDEHRRKVADRVVSLALRLSRPSESA